jgi:predicted O-methyltransferase YrrM
MSGRFWETVAKFALTLLHFALGQAHRSQRRLSRFMFDFEPVRIDPRLVVDAKVYANRLDVLERLPKGGVAIEVGTERGLFAREIMDRVRPKKFYTIDIDYAQFQFDLFSTEEITSRRIEFRAGFPAHELSKFADKSIDFIYINAGNDFRDAEADIEVSAEKLKETGVMVLNDYTTWSVPEMTAYGVMAATNAFCNRRGWLVRAIGLHDLGSHDIAITPPTGAR